MAKSLDIIDPKRELREEEDSRAEDSDLRMPQRGNDGSGGGVFYLVLGIIAIVVATGAALYILYKDYLPKKNAQATATSTASLSASATVSASTTASTTTTATVSTFNYNNEEIRIVNGNGISGEASKVKDELESKGFQVASTGNASKTYSETIIYYKSGQEKLAEALKSSISSLYSGNIEESNAVVGNYDAIIALGSK